MSISAVVIHDTASKTAEEALSWFADKKSKVSSHFVIDLDGTVYQCVPEDRRAWHAGTSTLHGASEVNDFSVGIEVVDADDSSPYPAAQMDAVETLVADLCERYKIPLNRVVGHQHICVPPGRKQDPGTDWPWRAFLMRVAARELGLALEGR